MARKSVPCKNPAKCKQKTHYLGSTEQQKCYRQSRFAEDTGNRKNVPAKMPPATPTLDYESDDEKLDDMSNKNDKGWWISTKLNLKDGSTVYTKVDKAIDPDPPQMDGVVLIDEDDWDPMGWDTGAEWVSQTINDDIYQDLKKKMDLDPDRYTDDPQFDIENEEHFKTLQEIMKKDYRMTLARSRVTTSLGTSVTHYGYSTESTGMDEMKTETEVEDKLDEYSNWDLGQAWAVESEIIAPNGDVTTKSEVWYRDAVNLDQYEIASSFGATANEIADYRTKY